MATVHDLLERLSRPGTITVPAGELRVALGVSPATLSRLVAAAGDDVVRLGRTRAVEYARTRQIEALGRHVPMFRVAEDGTPHRTGRLVFISDRATWLEHGSHSRAFVGLPPLIAQMAPEGYLGLGFPARFPELGLPPRIKDWSDDHRLRALALRGEDTIGDVLVGSESLARFLRWSPQDLGPDSFPALAERSALDVSGSSAGGERPKFGVFSRGRHVLVKFAPPGEAPAARRWRDLLWCEAQALELIAQAGYASASRATIHDSDGWRFLETERFDRVGLRGRRAVLTLAAIVNEYVGDRGSWTVAAERLEHPETLEGCPFRLGSTEAARVRWLDVFGQLTGNADRHLGNITFFVSEGGKLRVAPAYDTAPMVLAPSAADTLVERAFVPAPPSGETLSEWKQAAPWAVRFWRDVAGERGLADSVRQQARSAAQAVERLGRVVMPAEWARAYAAVRVRDGNAR